MPSSYHTSFVLLALPLCVSDSGIRFGYFYTTVLYQAPAHTLTEIDCEQHPVFVDSGICCAHCWKWIKFICFAICFTPARETDRGRPFHIRAMRLNSMFFLLTLIRSSLGVCTQRQYYGLCAHCAANSISPVFFLALSWLSVPRASFVCMCIWQFIIIKMRLLMRRLHIKL